MIINNHKWFLMLDHSRSLLFHFGFLLMAQTVVFAATTNYGISRSISASAVVSSVPNPAIALIWPLRTDIDTYTIEITAPDRSSRLETIAGNATGYTDTAVVVGSEYEYRIRGDVEGTSRDAYSAVKATIEAPLIEDRGIVVLVVDATKAAVLTNQLSQLKRDFIGDGWCVRRIDVSPDLPAVAVREAIRTIYQQAPTEVKAAFLLGNIATPYSGSITPDGHYGDHTGAWPADVYYGEMTDQWRDSAINTTQATRPENHNVPWDGKFDTSRVSSDVEIAIGRVDFSNLPAFSDSEEALLANYLDKNHRYRHRKFTLDQQGFIQDGLNWLTTAPGSGAHRAASACFGQNRLTTGSWDSALQDTANSYAIAWGLSTGSYTYLNGVTSATLLATRDYRAGFEFFLGSYSGDWDNADNLLRSALASGSHTVVSGWSGRPIWNLHVLATGKTIGEALLSMQNHVPSTQAFVGHGSRYVHTALMGDPTLRLSLASPPVGLTIAAGPVGAAELSWQAPADSVDGYHVYRANDWNSHFVRQTSSPLTSTNFIDNDSVGMDAIYMVRSLAVQTTGGGTFHNASQGVFATRNDVTNQAALPTVAVETPVATIHELGDQTTTFVVTREGSVSEALDLNFAIGGGTNGVELSYGATDLSIPAGESEVSFTVSALANARLEPDRAVTFLLLDSPKYELPDQGVAVSTLQDAAFDQWRKQHFTFNELNNASISGAQGDADEDQVPNIFEYAMGLNPGTYSSIDMTVIPSEAEDACDTVVYTRSTGPLSDVTVILETCDDGVSWDEAKPDTLTVDPVPGVPGLERVTANFACGLERRFFRITIQTQS